MLKKYYRLTKPGIVYGNALTTLAAFLFASRWQFPVPLLLATLFGIALVVASACVFNNYFDRDIDRTMTRTKNRALAAGTISNHDALSFGALLGTVGFALLFWYVNVLTMAVALFGFLVYVAAYTPLKRTSHWGVLVGSLAGAAPILVGYTAVRNTFDLPALVLFLILALWQMPHFYAIALYRGKEYAAAGIPVLPLAKGARRAKVEIVLYISAFTLVAPSLSLFDRASLIYATLMLVLGLWWLSRAVRGFTSNDDAQWARGLFRNSLVVMMSFSVLLALASVLP